MVVRILIVEDEGITALDVEQYLTEEGYSVCTAATAREGAEKIHTFNPDLVFMDIDLGGRSMASSSPSRSRKDRMSGSSILPAMANATFGPVRRARDHWASFSSPLMPRI